MKKGIYGYVDKKKIAEITKALIMFFLAILIFIIGYLVNNKSKQNIFSVISILFTLPASRNLVGYIVLYRYHTPKLELYNELIEITDESTILYSDLAISSVEKTMYIDFMIILANNIVLFTNNKNQDKNYIEKYLKGLLSSRNLNYKIYIYDDFNKFIEKINLNKKSSIEHSKKDEIKIIDSLIKSLII
ncbi:MAG TPA: hypothetical protein GXZ90_01335 [Clostridiales bacterium]|nr:hypothetical protein [Clostridiales bacterium]